MDKASTGRSLIFHWLGARRTWRGVLADMAGGIVLPVILLILNRVWDPLHLLSEVGATLSPLPRLNYLVTISALVMLALGFWLAVGTRARRGASFIGGVLLLGSLFAVGLGVASIVRLNFIGLFLCIPALLALFVYATNGIRAFREAGRGASWACVALSALAGMLSIVGISLVLHKQPWELVECLPHCQAADLSDSDLRHIYLSGCDGNPDLSYANLSNTDLSHAYLGACDLGLHGAVLQGADMSHTTLTVVDLSDADLREANLDGALLYMVDLSGADLRESQLNFESWGRVLMMEADLRGADLRGADLGLSIVYMDGAKYDVSTRWPQSFDPAEFGAVLQK